MRHCGCSRWPATSRLAHDAAAAIPRTLGRAWEAALPVAAPAYPNAGTIAEYRADRIFVNLKGGDAETLSTARSQPLLRCARRFRAHARRARANPWGGPAGPGDRDQRRARRGRGVGANRLRRRTALRRPAGRCVRGGCFLPAAPRREPDRRRVALEPRQLLSQRRAARLGGANVSSRARGRSQLGRGVLGSGAIPARARPPPRGLCGPVRGDRARLALAFSTCRAGNSRRGATRSVSSRKLKVFLGATDAPEAPPALFAFRGRRLAATSPARAAAAASTRSSAVRRHEWRPGVDVPRSEGSARGLATAAQAARRGSYSSSARGFSRRSARS